MSKPVKNVAASVRQKLANLAKDTIAPLKEFLVPIVEAGAARKFTMRWTASGTWKAK